MARISAAGFYRKWVGTALAGSWDRASTASAVTLALLAVVTFVLPSTAPLEEGAKLTAAVGFLGLIVAARALKAPLDLYRALEAEANVMRSELDVRSIRTAEAERLQGIADSLTSLYEYGVHSILHVMPDLSDDTGGLTDWAARLNDFNNQAVQTIIDCGCTVQELNQVRTIAVYDLDAPTAGEMHELRLKRIDAIAKRYAGDAREVKKRLLLG